MQGQGHLNWASRDTKRGVCDNTRLTQMCEKEKQRTGLLHEVNRFAHSAMHLH